MACGRAGGWRTSPRPRRLRASRMWCSASTICAAASCWRRRSGRPGHGALAELERRWPGPVQVVTQNIDDLHERAGSEKLIHMHGELLKARCTACAAVSPWRDDLAAAHRCPTCGRADALRPHVVWFGEMPLELDAIYAALAAICSSRSAPGQVYPAAGFVEEVRRHGRAHTVEITSSRAPSTACSPSGAADQRAKSCPATSMTCWPPCPDAASQAVLGPPVRADRTAVRLLGGRVTASLWPRRHESGHTLRADPGEQRRWRLNTLRHGIRDRCSAGAARRWKRPCRSA